MVHPMVTQLHFARSEFLRCMKGVPPEDAFKRIEPMNCLSWIVGHLAAQEQSLWIECGLGSEGTVIDGELRERVGFGSPPSTPNWKEMWTLWHEITAVADEFLGGISDETLDDYLTWKDKPLSESVGILLLRNIYHYWHHIGEAHAIRQLLGHDELPVFVGGMQAVRVK